MFEASDAYRLHVCDMYVRPLALRLLVISRRLADFTLISPQLWSYRHRQLAQAVVRVQELSQQDAE